MIKRLPLILFILTLVSGAFMILIRIAGSGERLLSAKTGTGRFVAANYHSCIIVFLVILCAFIAATIVINRMRKKKKGIRTEDMIHSEQAIAYPGGLYAEAPSGSPSAAAFSDIPPDSPAEPLTEPLTESPAEFLTEPPAEERTDETVS